ncbi:MAG: molybdopterin molybdotransferase MoeA [Alphaproteobacteria bacterium]|nr:molybdopterin molybdotransferase MoeA [Alphaproteobacteria bacterium]MDD9919058.1 molybdopterin molybdotransferase MoeA [Alphaproteobacteria bacterium]
MISYQQACDCIAARAASLETEIVPLAEALHRVLAVNIVSKVSLPSFANSAMDGFVCRTEDVDSPNLICVGKVAAGDTVPEKPLNVGTCLEIMTGAPVPQNGTTVIPVEQVEREGDMVHVLVPPKAGQHVRLSGEDIRQGEALLAAGTLLQASQVGMLAAIGQADIIVHRQPRVAVLTTGNEVVADLKATLEAGQIYNSSLYYLQAMLPQLGAKVVYTAVLPDDVALAEEAFKTALAKNIDMIMTTGAVSAGKYDFVPALWEKMGGETLFHKVAQRPGKPILVGYKNNSWLLGLPGNPVSTMAGLRGLGSVLLRTLQGLPQEQFIEAKLVSTVSSKAGFTHLQKAELFHQDGEACVSVSGAQASFQLKPFVTANAWVVVPEDKKCLAIGETVKVMPHVWPELTGFQQQGEWKNVCNAA